jgi:hypothetical protein
MADDLARMLPPLSLTNCPDDKGEMFRFQSQLRRSEREPN